MPRLRLLPLVAFAAFCLLVLKMTALVIGAGYAVSGVGSAIARDSGAPSDDGARTEAEQADETPDEDKTKPTLANAAMGDVTPTAPGSSEADDPLAQAEGASEKPSGEDASADAPAPQTPQGPMLSTPQSEIAVLESLAGRRKTLDRREREIGLRENLLKAAEKKVEERIAVLKTLQSKIDATVKAEDDARDAELARLVQMYARMKPKEAAAVFNRLDLEVLAKIAKQMKPAEMSSILAAMEPEAAERLTLELARQSAKRPQLATAELPKVEPSDKR